MLDRADQRGTNSQRRVGDPRPLRTTRDVMMGALYSDACRLRALLQMASPLFFIPALNLLYRTYSGTLPCL